MGRALILNVGGNQSTCKCGYGQAIEMISGTAANQAWCGLNHIYGERGIYDENYIKKYQIFNCFVVGNNKGRRKNAPARTRDRESNAGSLVYETSALTIEPRELVWLDRHQIR